MRVWQRKLWLKHAGAASALRYKPEALSRRAVLVTANMCVPNERRNQTRDWTPKLKADIEVGRSLLPTGLRVDLLLSFDRSEGHV